MRFHEWKILYFDSIFTEVCSQGPNWQYSSIGSDDGLAPTRRQAIIWTNADPFYRRIYAALGGDELACPPRYLSYVVKSTFDAVN